MPSSERLTVCDPPSAVTGIGVTWLPTTTPRVWSTICANTCLTAPVAV